MQIDDNRIDTLKRSLQEFLEDEVLEGKYIDRIKQTIQDGKFRLLVNVNDLRNWNREFTDNLMRRPREYMVALQLAATESVQNIDPTLSKYLKTKELQIGFEGSFGRHSVSPRSLSSSLLNQLVEVEGIVTKCSLIRPKLIKSVHLNPQSNQYTTREYRDDYSLDIGIPINGRVRLPTGSAVPTKDGEGNPLDYEYGLCQYKDCQTVILQEMPERSKVGQLPRSIEIVLEHDLADHLKPGDRVQCVGVYRPLPRSQMGVTNGMFPSVLICNNVSIIGKEIGAVNLNGTDVKNIRELSRTPNVLNILSNSLCPSIMGHEYIKKALILQLLGGSERNLPNGHHLRGDINVLMVGDPSTAKSQLLRSIMDIAPLAISTTGRGSSGVGLTAAVTLDSDSRERRLEAGAMVLADRGIVCIDEFDKMSENDRVAIHEVMEQQTVTIAKAGIHASLNARCSVLAAANPVYGQYDRTRRPQDNIGLPDSLLSRFDLLFIVLDQLDPIIDKRISEHVVKSHQYRKPGTLMEPEPLNQKSKLILDTFDREEETLVYLRINSNINKNAATSEHSRSQHTNKKEQNDDLLTQEFLRKYIHFAKNRIFPTLSDEAMEMISNAYATMRSKQSLRTLPVTARSLETIIRLSNASAKCRLSQSVDEIDVDIALELMNYVLYHEIGSETSGNTSSSQINELIGKGRGNMINSVNKENLDTSNEINKRPRLLTGIRAEEEEDEGDYESDNLYISTDNLNRNNNNDSDINDGSDLDKRYSNRQKDKSITVYSDNDIMAVEVDTNSERYNLVIDMISQLNPDIGTRIYVNDILIGLNAHVSIVTSGNYYTLLELQAILSSLERDNKLMYVSDEGYAMLI